MKPTLGIFFLLLSAFCALADCLTNECDKDHNGDWTIQKIADCTEDKLCTRTKRDFDPELDKRKNISRDDQQPVRRSIRWIKGLDYPTNLTECGSRDELKQLGEGQKITVVAWALTAKSGSTESANCDLPHQVDQDNHIVLVDPRVKNPTMDRDEIRSVTAEFTPRVRLDNHPNFNRRKLNGLIRSGGGKLLVRVTGLLMFDSKHFFHDSLIRDTDWEVHPVLKMEFCPSDKTCRADSDENWKDLDNE